VTPNDIRFLNAFNSRMSMYISFVSRESVVSYLHGYEAGSAGRCQFSASLSEWLSARHQIERMAQGWPHQVEVFAQERSLSWIEAYQRVSSEVLQEALKPEAARGESIREQRIVLSREMSRSLSRVEVRDVDRRAIAEYGLPGVVLMENAGRGTAELLHRFGVSGPVLICAGKGNNGGDGFVIARHLERMGIAVRVLLFCQPTDLTGDAAINYRVLERAGLAGFVMGVSPEMDQLHRELAKADWIVDALLGTGTRGTIQEPMASIIDAINQAQKMVLAVDLPSGLDCDTGKPLGKCIRAEHTATFVSRKLGFDNPESAEWTGTVHVIEIGVPTRLLQEVVAGT